MSTNHLKPGVVTGDDYKTLVAAAKEGGYALPAVNVTSTNTANAVLEAAALAKSDVMQAKDLPMAPWPRFWVRWHARSTCTCSPNTTVFVWSYTRITLTRN
jgi:hypothetical protein